MPALLMYRPFKADTKMNEAHHPQVEGSEPGAWDARHEEFVQTHLKRIFSIVYRILGNVEDAQDVTQEVFIRALQRRDQLKDLDKAAHWLSRIASNAAIDHLRRKKRITWTELDEPLQNTLPAGAESSEDLLLRSERRAQLQSVLDQLTPRERAALILRDVEDLPAEEVARLLNCGKATVRSHIANARAKFKRLMGAGL
jgi:RNA polymerase sigma-70 factor (ECF subfamily)